MPLVRQGARSQSIRRRSPGYAARHWSTVVEQVVRLSSRRVRKGRALHGVGACVVGAGVADSRAPASACAWVSSAAASARSLFAASSNSAAFGRGEVALSALPQARTAASARRMTVGLPYAMISSLQLPDSPNPPICLPNPVIVLGIPSKRFCSALAFGNGGGAAFGRTRRGGRRAAGR